MQLQGDFPNPQIQKMQELAAKLASQNKDRPKLVPQIPFHLNQPQGTFHFINSLDLLFRFSFLDFRISFE